MAGNGRIRTDLALEATERFAQEHVEIRGVEVQEETDEEKHIRTTVVKITTENGAKAMDVPRGIILPLKRRIFPWRMRTTTGKFPERSPAI